MIKHPTQPELYDRFKALHEASGGFITPNVWDGGSALIMLDAGFKALATSPGALATALGRLDRRHAVSREEHLAHARIITQTTGLLVNGELEDGFGPEPSDVTATVEAAIAAGLAGVGIDDTTGNPEKPLHDFEKAVARIKTAADAAKGRIVLTTRAENFIQDPLDLDDTIRRLTAFAEVGADVLFAPLLYGLSLLSRADRIMEEGSRKGFVMNQGINITDRPRCNSSELTESNTVKRKILPTTVIRTLLRVTLLALAWHIFRSRYGK